MLGIRSVRVNLKRWTRYHTWGREAGHSVPIYQTCRRVGPIAVCADDWRKQYLWASDPRHCSLRCRKMQEA